MRPLHAMHHYVEQLWWQTDSPPLPLRWASHIYGTISRRQLQQRARNMQTPPIPMLSVGNITVGGSGKTPFVIWLAQALKHHGYTPVILCRGDGGNAKEPQLLGQHSRPEVVGDEACLLFEASGCPVISGRDRIAGSRMTAGLGNVLILDDGFQYRQLQRVCDIVLVPAEGLGNGHLLPAGPLREPPSALQRADILVRTGKPPATPLTDAREWTWRPESSEWVDIRHTDTGKPERCLAVAAIARPERFFNSLRTQGCHVAETCVFPDHYRFSRRDVEMLISHHLPVVVTGKDAVKLRHLWPKDQPLWVLQQHYQVEEGLLEAIMTCLPAAKWNVCLR
ncbi:MAG: tetraacyldisaccharide 4'-kinase [Mariprofundaceae bacterium]|nr:tetraacyldisaccharide 4'-kinase [Mariprofundaceae bacterium]